MERMFHPDPRLPCEAETPAGYGVEEGGVMAKAEEKVEAASQVYSLTGTLIEACSCSVLCPCWIGEDPDLGDCRAIVAYHIDDGHVGGLDISGLSFVSLTYIPERPGRELGDRGARGRQRLGRAEGAPCRLHRREGGPLADFAQLIGKVKGSRACHQARGRGRRGDDRDPRDRRNRRWSPIGARQVA